MNKTVVNGTAIAQQILVELKCSLLTGSNEDALEESLLRFVDKCMSHSHISDGTMAKDSARVKDAGCGAELPTDSDANVDEADRATATGGSSTSAETATPTTAADADTAWDADSSADGRQGQAAGQEPATAVVQGSALAQKEKTIDGWHTAKVEGASTSTDASGERGDVGAAVLAHVPDGGEFVDTQTGYCTGEPEECAKFLEKAMKGEPEDEGVYKEYLDNQKMGDAESPAHEFEGEATEVLWEEAASDAREPSIEGEEVEGPQRRSASVEAENGTAEGAVATGENDEGSDESDDGHSQFDRNRDNHARSHENHGQGSLLSKGPKFNRELWRLRESIGEALRHDGYVYKYDISVPLATYMDVVALVREQVRGTSAIRVCGFGHMGDSNLHLNITAAGWDEALLGRIEPFVYEWTASVRGSISAEHGIGLHKKRFLHLCKTPAALGAMRSLKRAFDPLGILNPYKMLPPSS
ncbi:hypothetical protein HPB52_007362 [Rhipicephalus sanguineus]|uniref:D-2-hydroxyglutarate dehydrogenase, mitochondrial n=1 Tax=Rhipicephalus sanguineus TaxID=34632 RepID=A0A9D4T8U2_RHISA|nr:hypothetical protein HPB52_007362 [Rhipicephalus sanguineus]